MAIRKKYLGIDDYEGGMTQEVTPWAGVGLLLELFRRVGIGIAVEQALPEKRSPKGLRHREMVEAFTLLSALGGECVDDFEHLRNDEGLRAIMGYQLPAPSTARQWLDKAHEAELVITAKEAAQKMGFFSFIPGESAYLQGLKEGIRQVVLAYVETMKVGSVVTLDVDAHLVESSKQSAYRTYEGYRGYQPMIVTWGETNLVLRDEFRDGNVPAAKDIARVVDEAYDMLPRREGEELWKIGVRSDSAAYEGDILDHWQSRGWEFAVSADMSPQLREAVLEVREEEWQLWKEEAGGVLREWAEVPYVPSQKEAKKGTEKPLYRYVAIRLRKRQGELFE